MLFRSCKLHYCVPSDLSLVSLKENDQNAISFPHISGIRIPWQEFGRFVCEQLIEKCEKTASDDAVRLFAADFCFDSEDSIRIPSSLCSKKLVVVGSINSDMTFNVDFLPQAGKTTKILNATRTVGGKGANQAVGVAKLNCKVTLIGEIGNDIDSSFIMDALWACRARASTETSTHPPEKPISILTATARAQLPSCPEPTPVSLRK